MAVSWPGGDAPNFRCLFTGQTGRAKEFGQINFKLVFHREFAKGLVHSKEVIQRRLTWLLGSVYLRHK